MLARPLATAALFAALLISSATAGEKDKKDEKRSGTVVGTLTGKGKDYVEVKADGEEKGRKYVPHWVGGAPDKGGGPDKKVLKTIADLKVGSRVRLEWEFEERARIVKIEVLKAAGGKDGENKDRDKKEGGEEAGRRKGTALGTLAAKGKNYVELKADGEEKARKYFLHSGGTKELLKAMEETPVGTRVEIDWMFSEHLHVLSLRPVAKKAVKD